MTFDRWVTVAGVIAGCLFTWLVSRHFYRRADRRRAPTFAVQSKRQSLSTPELVQAEGFSVLHCGREVGTQGINALKIYFWNSGTLPILPGDVLEPFTIRLPVPILRHEVLKKSRDAVGLRVITPEGPSPTKLTLEFSVLEPGDGATIKLIYDGPPDAQIEFGGACLDAARPAILPPRDLYFTTPLERFYQVLAVPMGVLVIAAAGGLIAGFIFLLKQIVPERWLAVGFEVLFAGFILFWVGLGAVGMYRWIVSTFVPPDIKP